MVREAKVVLITLSAMWLLNLHSHWKNRESKRQKREKRSEAVNCLSIQGEAGGEKTGRGRRKEVRKRRVTRGDTEKGGGEKFGKR